MKSKTAALFDWLEELKRYQFKKKAGTLTESDAFRYKELQKRLQGAFDKPKPAPLPKPTPSKSALSQEPASHDSDSYAAVRVFTAQKLQRGDLNVHEQNTGDFPTFPAEDAPEHAIDSDEWAMDPHLLFPEEPLK